MFKLGLLAAMITLVVACGNEGDGINEKTLPEQKATISHDDLASITVQKYDYGETRQRQKISNIKDETSVNRIFDFLKEDAAYVLESNSFGAIVQNLDIYLLDNKGSIFKTIRVYEHPSGDSDAITTDKIKTLWTQLLKQNTATPIESYGAGRGEIEYRFMKLDEAQRNGEGR